MSERYILSFYSDDEADSGIPDVHFAGGFSDIRTWARRRLDYLAAETRAPHQPPPRKCSIKDEEGRLLLMIELL